MFCEGESQRLCELVRVGRTSYLWEFEPVTQAVSGEDDHGSTGAAGGDGLLTKTTDAKNFTSDSELTSHGDSRIQGAVETKRHQTCSHRDTCARAVLLYGTFGAVQMYPGLLEELVLGVFLGHEALGE